MTPRNLRARLLDNLDLYPGIRVLDPGCGTGEFLRDVLDRQPTAQITGWDSDHRILKCAEELVPEGEFVCRDALDPSLAEPFDLVIGNPPYFQFRASSPVRKYFADVISGRPNIFSLFFKVGIENLRDGGQLGYVVPPSMNNGAYFNSLRAYIKSMAAIEFLEIFADPFHFEDAQTEVQLIVIRKGRQSDAYSISVPVGGRKSNLLLFASDADDLAGILAGGRSLDSLGFTAVTGTVVWNTRKSDLRSEKVDGAVQLVWAHNIRGGRVMIDETNEKRPQYVVNTEPLTGPAIVVNRIVGSVGSGELRAGLIESGRKFVGENHVNVILPTPGAEISCEQLLSLLMEPEVITQVRKITGNTQISATELKYLVRLPSEQ
jgi:adenine-specific DNA-methyltransferase